MRRRTASRRGASPLADPLFPHDHRPGRCSAPAAVCIGLAMDLTAGDGGFTHAAAYAFAAILVSVTCRGNRVGSALWFVFSVLCFALPMSAQIGLVLVYETLAATLLFLLIPPRFFRGRRLDAAETAQADTALHKTLTESAATTASPARRSGRRKIPPPSSTARRKRSAAAARCAISAGKRSISGPTRRSTTRPPRCCAAGRARAKISRRILPTAASVFRAFCPP